MPKIAMYTVGEYLNDNDLRLVLITHNRIKANDAVNVISSRGNIHYIKCEMMDLQKYLWLNKENLTLMEIKELTDKELKEKY